MQSETRREINCSSLAHGLGSYKITALAGEVDGSRRGRGGGGKFYDLVNQREFVNAGSERKQRRQRLLLSVSRGEG